jgi:ABC-type sugar transport system ATPase subunit
MRRFDGYATGSRAESSAAPLSRSARQEPRSRFASGRNNNASFIGAPAMNLIKGSMTADGLRTEDGILLPTSGRPGNAAAYGIRPENIHFEPNGIEVKIVALELTGSETLVIANLATTPSTV